MSEEKNSQGKNQLKRTDAAELYVEKLLSIPFFAEFVFRSPTKVVGGSEKEVADLLISLGSMSVLISQKCQQDPDSRDQTKTESWARKQAKNAAAQLQGALRTGSNRPAWCNHPRRGRVNFPNGLPAIGHGIVLIEVFQVVDLKTNAAELPLEYKDTPISYFSLNDFLNIAVELRTVPELLLYLEARRCLPPTDLRVIGDEKTLFEFYLLNDDSLNGCSNRTVATATIASQQTELKQIVREKKAMDVYSHLLEQVAHALATRDDKFSSLPTEVQAYFEPLDRREGYLKMQAVIGDMRLPERILLGQKFSRVMEMMNGSSNSQNMSFQASLLTSKPDWMFVFVSCISIDRAELHRRMTELSIGALAYYDKSKCLLIADRAGEGFELALNQWTMPFTDAQRALGRLLFGQLRMESKEISLTR